MTEFQVSHRVTWIVEGTDGSNVALPSLLSWTSENPLAVHACFGDPDVGGAVEWIFGRDLLIDVVLDGAHTAGEGDVTVARRKNAGLAGPAKDQLILTLSVGHVVNLRTDLVEIKIFLQNTFIYAPQGQEVVDVDTTIEKLLDGGWASGV
jgi:hypothetical protein